MSSDTTTAEAKDTGGKSVVDANPPLAPEDLFNDLEGDDDMPGLNDYSDDEDCVSSHHPLPVHGVEKTRAEQASPAPTDVAVEKDESCTSHTTLATQPTQVVKADLEGFFSLLGHVLKKTHGAIIPLT
ncbi:hypothetical protein CPC08DRAFT_755164 [Agrocybe pediades]|nr:hypothetical protein CPC08DRAFT_755164 [Agrocybe pediades]